MNIVDININVCKYILPFGQRHVSHVNDISYWLCIDKNIFNCTNKQIINNHKKFLNQKNIIIILKCIKYKISIIPVSYCIINHVNLLIKESSKYQNVNMLKLIDDHINIEHNQTLFEHVKIFYSYKYVKLIKFLYRNCKWTKQDFQSNDNYICIPACENGHVDVVKYLHQKIGLTKHDFQSKYNWKCQMACEYGRIDVVKYLHHKIRLTKEDFQSRDNYACEMACYSGHTIVIKYLHQEIGLEKEDFQSNNNSAFKSAFQYGQFDIIKYLHKEIGFTKKDFHVGYLFMTSRLVHIAIVKYIEDILDCEE